MLRMPAAVGLPGERYPADRARPGRALPHHNHDPPRLDARGADISNQPCRSENFADSVLTCIKAQAARLLYTQHNHDAHRGSSTESFLTAFMDRRRAFDRLRGRPAPIRPPGSCPEPEFDALCTRCGDCRTACPEAIVVAGGGNLPEVDFSRGACTFCGRCAEACATGAIPGEGSWPYRARVGASCLETQGVTCRVCETTCEALALRFRPMTGGRSDVSVDMTRCTGCGACVAVCPVSAIAMIRTSFAEEPACNPA